MTDTTELVKRLRASDAHPLSIHGQTMAEAADALEAQVRRIADLHKEVRIMDSEYKTAIASIAELEALLKDCADDLEAEVDARYGENAKKCMPHRYERDMAPVVAARAALNGEK